jgi:hypothetical protein
MDTYTLRDSKPARGFLSWVARFLEARRRKAEFCGWRTHYKPSGGWPRGRAKPGVGAWWR